MIAENRLIQKMLENRGLTLDAVEKFDHPEHSPLFNIDELCLRLHEIREKGTHLTVLSDYDMDGIMSGVVAYAGLSEMGFPNVSLYIPDPSAGYGFDDKTIVDLMQQCPRTQAIITGDVGITCYDGIREANRCGLEVLVTDHHLELESGLPEASVVVDPMQAKDTYEHPQICGAYVMYQCLQRFADMYCDRHTAEQVRRLRVFAGIGTVSDYMPLLYENRQLVRDCVSICRLLYCDGSDFVVNHFGTSDVCRRAFRGLYEVLREFESIGKIHGGDDIDESFFGYYLAPTFNSVKRVGLPTDMARVFGVFFGANVKEDVAYLVQLNEKRKEMVSDCMDRMMSQDQPYAPYIYITDAPSGVLGPMAQRIVSETGEPAIIVAKDATYHGSGRSPAWYPFITRTAMLNTYAAGHNVAFGVGFSNEKEVRKLYRFLKEDVAKARSETDMSKYELPPDFIIDHDGSGDTVIDILLFLEYLEDLRAFQPFGAGFPAPNVELRFRPIEGEWSTMGSKDQHLKIRLAHGLEVLCWNQADKITLADETDKVRLHGHLGVSEFRGSRTINFVGDFVG